MKRLFIRFDRSKQRNEEWFNFYTEFKKAVEEFLPGVLNIEELFAVFLTLYAMADEALEKIRKSGFTEVMSVLDADRDGKFRGLADSVKSALNHFDSLKRKAAANLTILFDHYGNLAAKPYDEETGGIYNFLQELREKYAADMETLGLMEWANELERSNIEFSNAVTERSKETAGKTELIMVDVRKQTDRCYVDILERIEALALINGEENFKPFIKFLNAISTRYKNRLNRRGGGSGGSDNTDENREENEDPEKPEE